MELPANIIKSVVRRALVEDRVNDDITSITLAKKFCRQEFKIVSREEGIICGLHLAEAVFKTLDVKAIFSTKFQDGDKIRKHQKIAIVTGQARAILAGERSGLNFLGHLSGIATFTYEFVKKAKRFNIQITDTRKTHTGLRFLEKYAVICGKGINHRMNLSDMVLIKENHIKLYCELKSKKLLTAKDYKHIINIFRQKHPLKKITVEVENLAQVKKLIVGCPEMIMLDNMKPAEIKKIIALIKKHKNKLKKLPILEVSGNINLQNIDKFLINGINRLSIGSIIHSAPYYDFTILLN